MLHFIVLNYTKCKSCLSYNNNSKRKCKRKDINMKKKDRIYRNTVLLKLGLKVKYIPFLQCSDTIQLPNEFLRNSIISAPS